MLKLPGLPAGFNLQAELQKIQPQVFAQLAALAVNGSGIAQFNALKLLKEWADEQVPQKTDSSVIAFETRP